jgi:hypothetical protein
VAFGHNRGTGLETFVREVWLLAIADNGSTDDSWPTATGLAENLPNVRAARLEERLGRKELRFRWITARRS